MSRINEYPEALSAASDDYLLVDGSTNGTRKIKPSGFVDTTLIQPGQAADSKAVGDEIADLKSALADVRVEKEIQNLLEISSENARFSNTENPPTATYPASGSAAFTGSSVTDSSVGYTLPTVAGKTYKLHFATDAITPYSVRIVKNSAFSLSTTIKTISNVVAGTYNVTFEAITNETTVWFGVPRNVSLFTISNVYVIDTANKTWKYGSLDESLLSEDFPPSGKTVGAALIPHIIGETNTFAGENAGKNTVESTDQTSSETYDKGRYNTAFGTNSFRQNTDGHHSTAIGFCALRNNTSGCFNTAIGEDALYDNTTESANTGIGSHAMQKNKSSYAVSIGAESSRYPTSMPYCVAIGYHANYTPYNGEGNVFIGADAGLNADADNVIAIGNGVKADTDNQIILGNFFHNDVIIAGRRITFNQDGTVTWSAIT